MGFHRGAVCVEFRALAAWGKKLLSSLVERALMLRYRLPSRSVLHDTIGFTGASYKENIQDGGERGTDDFCSGVHCPLEGLAVPVPDSDAAGQHTLNGTPVEAGEDGCRETCSFQPAEKV